MATVLLTITALILAAGGTLAYIDAYTERLEEERRQHRQELWLEEARRSGWDPYWAR